MTREEAIEHLKEWREVISSGNRKAVIDMAIKALQVEPKHGEWIVIDDTHSQCTECGAIFCITSSEEWEVNYCPNCGARMGKEREE